MSQLQACNLDIVFLAVIIPVRKNPLRDLLFGMTYRSTIKYSLGLLIKLKTWPNTGTLGFNSRGSLVSTDTLVILSSITIIANIVRVARPTRYTADIFLCQIYR
jgi:hypothetical protein